MTMSIATVLHFPLVDPDGDDCVAHIEYRPVKAASIELLITDPTRYVVSTFIAAHQFAHSMGFRDPDP